MRFPRLLISFFVFLLLFFVSAGTSSASEEFTINFNTTYNVRPDGTAEVSQNITLINNLSRVYATSYSLVIEGKTPTGARAHQQGSSLPIEISQENEQKKITVLFPDAVVGKGEKRDFTIEYQLAGTAVQNGQVWELTIPKLASPEDIDSYRLELRVPREFGNPAYISPQARQKVSGTDYQAFVFQKEDLAKAGIVAAFGEFQVFSFSLKYHIKNPLKGTGETQIALPPDTAFQRVYYEDITPKPVKIELDMDGNWLATYRLGGGQLIDVTARGSVQIFTTPQERYPQSLPAYRERYLAPNRYWPSEDPQIQELARTLKTPRAIYDYIVSNFSYDYSRVREGVERLGAKQALANPASAICMEFTDTFIALARSAGIPAREVNGFAYTDNPEIQPLSLVADVLHAWPEYWDENRGVWQPVDPTWGNTTGGVDFFNKFDLSHFVFVIHGMDVNSPPPAGSYKTGESPQKDVDVTFGTLPENRNPNLHFSASLPLLVPWQDTHLEVSVKNSGPVALYDIPLGFEANNLVIVSAQEKLDFLPPFSEVKIPVVLRLPLFSTQPQQLLLSAHEASFLYNIPQKRVLALQISTIFAALVFLLGASLLIFRLRIYAKITRIVTALAQRARSIHL